MFGFLIWNFQLSDFLSRGGRFYQKLTLKNIIKALLKAGMGRGRETVTDSEVDTAVVAAYSAVERVTEARAGDWRVAAAVLAGTVAAQLAVPTCPLDLLFHRTTAGLGPGDAGPGCGHLARLRPRPARRLPPHRRPLHLLRPGPAR